MNTTEIADKLEAYNRWRRSDADESDTWGPGDSAELGRTLDAAVAALRAAEAPAPDMPDEQVLVALSARMQLAAIQIEYHGGFCKERREWARKLDTAGLIVGGWAEKLARQCRRCGGTMAPGKALAQTATGSPDELGGDVVTMSPGGPGKLIDCLKCEACGHSVTGGGEG